MLLSDKCRRREHRRSRLLCPLRYVVRALRALYLTSFLVLKAVGRAIIANMIPVVGNLAVLLRRCPYALVQSLWPDIAARQRKAVISLWVHGVLLQHVSSAINRQQVLNTYQIELLYLFTMHDDHVAMLEFQMQHRRPDPWDLSGRSWGVSNLDSLLRHKLHYRR